MVKVNGSFDKFLLSSILGIKPASSVILTNLYLADASPLNIKGIKGKSNTKKRKAKITDSFFIAKNLFL